MLPFTAPRPLDSTVSDLTMSWTMHMLQSIPCCRSSTLWTRLTRWEVQARWHWNISQRAALWSWSIRACHQTAATTHHWWLSTSWSWIGLAIYPSLTLHWRWVSAWPSRDWSGWSGARLQVARMSPSKRAGWGVSAQRNWWSAKSWRGGWFTSWPSWDQETGGRETGPRTWRREDRLNRRCLCPGPPPTSQSTARLWTLSMTTRGAPLPWTCQCR